MNILVKIKKCMTLVIIQLSNYSAVMTIQTVVGKMKDETIGFTIKEHVRLKRNMYLYFWKMVVVSIKK